MALPQAWPRNPSSPPSPPPNTPIRPAQSLTTSAPNQFPTHNFYHSPLNLLILGFIRPEYDYKSLESLVSDIKTDCDVARRSLDRDGYRGYALDKGESGKWLRNFEWAEQLKGEEVEAVEARELGEGAGGKGEEKGTDGEGKL